MGELWKVTTRFVYLTHPAMPSMRSCYVWLPRLFLLALAVGGTVCVSSSWDTHNHKVCTDVCVYARPHFPYPVGGQYRVADCNNLPTPTFVFPSNGGETVGPPACPADSIFPVQARWDRLTELHKRNELKDASPELHGKLQDSEAELSFPMTIEQCPCGVLKKEWPSFWTKKVFVFWGVVPFLLSLFLGNLLFRVVECLSLCVIRRTLLASVDAIRVKDACYGQVTIDRRVLMQSGNMRLFKWFSVTAETPKFHDLLWQPMHADLEHFFRDAQNQYIRVLREIRDDPTRAKVTTAIAELELVADRWVMVQTIHFVSLVVCTGSGFAFGIYNAKYFSLLMAILIHQ